MGWKVKTLRNVNNFQVQKTNTDSQNTLIDVLPIGQTVAICRERLGK